MTAGDVMDASAALLNDQQKQIFTYTVQLPYLKIVLAELRELFELNNIPFTNESSTVLTIAAATSNVTISFSTTPALPSDLIDIQRMWERESGVDPFVTMERKEFLPHYLEGTERNYFSYFEWSGQSIKLLPANRTNDLKIDYIGDTFAAIVDQNSTIAAINTGSFLNYRLAAHCALFIGEDKPRSDDLNSSAALALDRVLGIGNKGKQAIVTRHRPFRASFKSHGY